MYKKGNLLGLPVLCHFSEQVLYSIMIGLHHSQSHHHLWLLQLLVSKYKCTHFPSRHLLSFTLPFDIPLPLCECMHNTSKPPMIFRSNTCITLHTKNVSRQIQNHNLLKIVYPHVSPYSYCLWL